MADGYFLQYFPQRKVQSNHSRNRSRIFLIGEKFTNFGRSNGRGKLIRIKNKLIVKLVRVDKHPKCGTNRKTMRSQEDNLFDIDLQLASKIRNLKYFTSVHRFFWILAVSWHLHPLTCPFLAIIGSAHKLIVPPSRTLSSVSQ